MYEEHYKLLADAIIVQAVKDYRRTQSTSVRNELKRFFVSDWFYLLANTDGCELFRRLEQEQEAKQDKGKEFQNVGIQDRKE